jgi:hypothetical protein
MVYARISAIAGPAIGAGMHQLDVTGKKHSTTPITNA